MPTEMALIDGEVMPLAEATVSVMDLGLLRGMAVFETMRTYGGHPYALREHLARLHRGLVVLGMDPILDEAFLRNGLRRCLEAGALEESRFMVLVTPGALSGDLFGGGEPTVVLMARKLSLPDPALYEQGAKVVTFEAQRTHAQVKTTNYLSGQQGVRLAAEAGAHEALYVKDGCVQEGVTSNVVAIVGDQAITPDEDALPGITLKGVEQLCRQLGLKWRRERLSVDELKVADEVWLTSSVREVMPVTCIDDATIGGGEPGPWFQRVGPAFHCRCRDAARDDATRYGAGAGT